ncbi:MAG: hypothetical protein M3076_00735 [Actinomycetota bacterium]|nr:hypothetical protein [Actinomycetota bacterium]
MGVFARLRGTKVQMEHVFRVRIRSNGYVLKVPARYATPSYDLASGLGVPSFDQIAAALPPPAT